VEAVPFISALYCQFGICALIALLLLLSPVLREDTEYAESTKDDFCSMASPANGDQDLLLDPLKGVLANPHKAFPRVYTGKNPIKSST